MSGEKSVRAQRVYNTLCGALDALSWKYDKDDDKLVVSFSLTGEDLPMRFIIFVDVDRQLVRLFSRMPFEMSEDKRVEGSIAACHAAYGLTDGCFEYDLSEGKITYRMACAFIDNDISVEIIHYMIDFACTVIDKYNVKFFAINKGYMTIEKFLED